MDRSSSSTQNCECKNDSGFTTEISLENIVNNKDNFNEILRVTGNVSLYEKLKNNVKKNNKLLREKVGILHRIDLEEKHSESMYYWYNLFNHSIPNVCYINKEKSLSFPNKSKSKKNKENNPLLLNGNFYKEKVEKIKKNLGIFQPKVKINSSKLFNALNQSKCKI